jgi:hypothetical protein
VEKGLEDDDQEEVQTYIYDSMEFYHITMSDEEDSEIFIKLIDMIGKCNAY